METLEKIKTNVINRAAELYMEDADSDEPSADYTVHDALYDAAVELGVIETDGILDDDPDEDDYAMADEVRRILGIEV
jgi:hypothetical protein